MSGAREELDQAVRRYLELKPARGVAPEDLVDALSVTAPVTFQAGETLCAQGGTAHALFFLLEGAVSVYRRDRRGEPRQISRVVAPAFLGHVALLDHAPRSATCVCESEVRVLSLDQVSCDRLVVEASPRGAALRRVLSASLCRHLERANDQVRALLAAAPSAAGA